jgi:hypothetical protein
VATITAFARTSRNSPRAVSIATTPATRPSCTSSSMQKCSSSRTMPGYFGDVWNSVCSM